MRPRSIAILGVPQDYGAGRRGVDMGPSAIRVANLAARLEELGHQPEDWGNLNVEQPERARRTGGRAHHLAQITDNCLRLSRLVAKAAAGGCFPLVLGGDHSIAAGSVAGMARYLRRSRKKLGLIWIDAHGDFNTPETSPSGNVHGMPLAAIAGLGVAELTKLAGFAPVVAPENVAAVALRDIDPGEARNIRQAGIQAFTMRDIDEKSLRAVIAEAIAIAMRGTGGYHLSLDMDALDPGLAPGVGTAVPGGLTYREAHLAMELLHDSHGLVSMDVVEVNPVLDVANQTANLAVELVLSAMGKRIL